MSFSHGFVDGAGCRSCSTKHLRAAKDFGRSTSRTEITLKARLFMEIGDGRRLEMICNTQIKLTHPAAFTVNIGIRPFQIRISIVRIMLIYHISDKSIIIRRLDAKSPAMADTANPNNNPSKKYQHIIINNAKAKLILHRHKTIILSPRSHHPIILTLQNVCSPHTQDLKSIIYKVSNSMPRESRLSTYTHLSHTNPSRTRPKPDEMTLTVSIIIP